MKRLLLVSLLFCFYAGSSQNPMKLLKKSFDKCQSVQRGYYEMIHSKKYMSREDTVSSRFECYFKKLDKDTLYSSAFHYQNFYEGEYIGDVMYTGNEFVTFDVKDSVGRIMVNELWAQRIDEVSHNYTFYTPLFDRKSNPLPNGEELESDENSFVYIGEEDINGIPVHHIQMNQKPDEDTTQMFRASRIEFHFWVNKKDFVPVQHTIAFDVVMSGDTMYQFETNTLVTYDLKNKDVDNHISMEVIPEHVVLKDYVPYNSPEPLPVDTIAPDWNLMSLSADSVRLSKLKGELVIIDFFYKSCFPCMQALPALQSLHEKYADRGMRMIGIDPYDTIEEDKIDDFLAKRGVTYTVLLGGKDVASQYRVSGYPTIYVVGKDGTIVYVQVGYGKGSEDELEKVILANL